MSINIGGISMEMKQTGMIRHFDALGRVVIPKDMRTQHGWGEGTQVEIIGNEEYVMIKSYRPSVEKEQDIAALEEAICHMRDIPFSEETIAKLQSLLDRMK